MAHLTGLGYGDCHTLPYRNVAPALKQYYNDNGMYCFFILHVLMCTAYTNLANTFLISFPSKNSDLSSKNSDLSSMLEA